MTFAELNPRWRNWDLSNIKITDTIVKQYPTFNEAQAFGRIPPSMEIQNFGSVFFPSLTVYICMEKPLP